MPFKPSGASLVDVARETQDTGFGPGQVTAGGVTSVTAADATVVIAGAAATPTVGVGAIPTSKVTGLDTALTGKLVKASNLTDLTDAAAARTSLGLGTAATHATGDYDAAGAAAAVLAALDFRSQQARAHNSGLTTLAHGAFTKVLIDTVTAPSFDPSGFFDAANHQFKGMAAGRYQVAGRVGVGNMAAGARLIVSVYVNGVEAIRGFDVSAGVISSELAGNASDVIAIGAITDTVDLRAFNSDSVDRSTDGAAYCYLTLMRVA